MWKALAIRALIFGLNWLLENGAVRVYTAPEAEGRRLGGGDVPGVIDRFLIIKLVVSDSSIFTGHWQVS